MTTDENEPYVIPTGWRCAQPTLTKYRQDELARGDLRPARADELGDEQSQWWCTACCEPTHLDSYGECCDCGEPVILVMPQHRR